MSDGKGLTRKPIKLEEDEFDSFYDKSDMSLVKRFTWTNSSDVTVQVITYGATITSIKMPDHDGHVDDIVMGFSNMAGYRIAVNPYFGATIGRVANRIGNGKFEIDGQTFQVTKNWRQHQLHGGFKGFDKVIWNYCMKDDKVIMTYVSNDGEEGFPGTLLVSATFELTDEEFLVEFKATTTTPTYVNLTNHSYFNLAGHDKGSDELYKHIVTINAEKITDVDDDSIPTGKLSPVTGTVFDLRKPTKLGDVMGKASGFDGYDHNFCINKDSEQENSFIARVFHPPTGRVLEIYSNQPGVQFYTSNFLPTENSAEVVKGKEGNYFKHGALCLETQNYPDAINHSNFPNAVLYPGEIYKHTIAYRFFLQPKVPEPQMPESQAPKSQVPVSQVSKSQVPESQVPRSECRCRDTL